MSVLPTDSLSTPRFVGLPSFMRLPMATELQGLDAAIVGLPSDSGAPSAPARASRRTRCAPCR